MKTDGIVISALLGVLFIGCIVYALQAKNRGHLEIQEKFKEKYPTLEEDAEMDDIQLSMAMREVVAGTMRRDNELQTVLEESGRADEEVETESETDATLLEELPDGSSEEESQDDSSDEHLSLATIGDPGVIFPLEPFLRNTLKSYGIEWWLDTALCQIYQESRFDIHAVAGHKNGTSDIGILQYKDRFWNDYASEAGWDGADINDPYIQIAVYSFHTAKRLNSGMSREEVISAHYTGGYTYSQTYVDQVLQWEETIERKEYEQIPWY